MTEKIYYINSNICDFTGRVLRCEPCADGWAVVLDRSAFFPQGGGQPGDRGLLGGVSVLDVRENGDEIEHICAGPLEPGQAAEGHVDAALRFARKQIHSAEHIVSGTAHRMWGCSNVGFHMTERSAVLDFDAELSDEQLRALERAANEAVWRDLPVNILYPSPRELGTLEFRQKKELTGQVRLVEIPGVDMCACCAPHVDRTGQIGLIRLTDSMRHRRGVRITMTAGRAAYEEALGEHLEAMELSRMFSVPRDALADGAGRLLAETEKQKERCAALEQRYTALLGESASVEDGRALAFLPGEFSAAALRSLAEALSAKADLAGVFAGDDETGWRYVLLSRTLDLRGEVKAMNAALRGRGGGSAAMVQGSVSASRGEIEEYFHGKG